MALSPATGGTDGADGVRAEPALAFPKQSRETRGPRYQKEPSRSKVWFPTAPSHAVLQCILHTAVVPVLTV